MQTDFKTHPKPRLLHQLDVQIKRGEQQMQRAKHAERRLATRRRLELGAAVEDAGAGHLSRADLIAILRGHLDGQAPESVDEAAPHALETTPVAVREGRLQ